MDFVKAATRALRGGGIEVYPKFLICPTKDLMIRGRDFYAVWLDKEHRWTTDEFEVIAAIDEMLREKAEEVGAVSVAWMWDADTKSIDRWHYYCTKQQHDHWKMLDSKLMFQGEDVKREDYVTKQLPYKLEPGDMSAYEELISTLYAPTERQKFEWMIGSILAGDSRTRDKCYVFYGAPKTGKSTALSIVESLFPGYCSAFSAKTVAERSNAFPLEQFKANPLVAIDHDGNLSRAEENSILNKLISHEPVMVNEKHKSTYQAVFQTVLLIATNSPVKITDSNSGMLRRLIDINPTGKKVSVNRYYKLISDIGFELGAIAYHCLNVFNENPHIYDDYEAREMMALSNDFYDFMIDMYYEFSEADTTTLAYAYSKYLEYCTGANINPMKKKDFKAELKSYFETFAERFGDKWYVYTGFLKNKFNTSISTIANEPPKKEGPWLKMNRTKSLFDEVMKDCPAQLTTSQGTPKKKWDNVTTTLKDIDTKELHFVKVPENHIVLDFDLTDENGNKSFEKNLEAASKFPETYAELSKSGQGIHLHYTYNGDVSKLSRFYEDKIEVKVFTGNSSLRRKLTKCNDIPIKPISWNLPVKGDTSVLQASEVKTEQHLRCLIKKCLAKEYGSTTCNVDFIAKLLSDSYDKVGFKYDVSDMAPLIYAFAANATNQAAKCIQTYAKMKFKSKDYEDADGVVNNPDSVDMTAPIAFFDVEVFPNLFLICWKEQGEGKPFHKLFNPEPKVIQEFIKLRLIGFNNRKYDNHMVYARLLGYSENEIFRLSDNLINKKSKNSLFGQAYNLSYTDVYDFSSATNKKSLKKWEIELGLHHQEFNWPWNKPLPQEMWEKAAEYCCNDVDATEKVFNHLGEDWLARQILAKLTGLTVNDTTNTLSARFIFGDDRHPQSQFNYRHMGDVPENATNDIVITKSGQVFTNVGDPKWNKFTPDGKCWFPDYKFEFGKSLYRGEDPKEGGYVYAEPGIWLMVALLDVESMHPSSAIAEELFGKYTQKFEDVKKMRLLIKHKEFEEAAKMFDGALKEYLKDKTMAKGLANALKTVINSVYGLTSAHFDNLFRDPRNIDNIVAKRGALFMINLKHEVQDRGFTVAHIKTDSIKIPNATPEIIRFVMDYGLAYGYKFAHEATYDRMCLVNNSVYIAKYATKEDCIATYGYCPSDNEDHGGEWTATGAQFQHPYVFKKCFTGEEIDIGDMAETKQAAVPMYLDMSSDPDKPQLQFVGKIGQFTPVTTGGGVALKEMPLPDGTVKYDAVNGTKGWRWVETEEFLKNGKIEDIDRSYYDKLANDAIDQINKYGDYYAFVA